MSFNFDRRTFLKGAGAVGAASLLAACGEKSNNTGNGAVASGAAAPNSTGATPLKEFISFESGNRELESWNTMRMPLSGPSTCGTTWTGWIATVR